MKKILTLLAGTLLAAVSLQAQQKQSKFFAQLSVGPSFPIGKFADKTYKGLPDETEPAGLAKLGLNTQLTIGYSLNDNFGLLFSPAYSVHAQDAQGYKDFVKASVYGAGVTTTSDPTLEAKSWQLLKLMAGGFMVTPLTAENKLVLVTKVAIGACKTAIPEYSFKGHGQGITTYSGKFNKTSLPWAFAYQISMGLKYKLKDKMHLLFDVNSFNSTPQKEVTYARPLPTSAGPSTPQQIKVKYKLAEVNALVGVGIDF